MDQNKKTTILPAKTIDEVLLQLDDIINQVVADNNFLVAFAYVYLETTKKVKNAIEDGRFEDPERMEKMDVTFANLYIKAFNDFQISNKISQTWKFSFDAKNEKLSLIQHILLGMNAHINMDLAIAAASVANGKGIIDLKGDFMVINEILAELTDIMQKGLGKVSILMKLLDFFGFRSDEKIINFSIKKARDYAWLNAMELALMEDNARKSRIEEIDLKVLELSKMIKKPPGKLLGFVLKFISLFETKDSNKIIEKMNRA